MPPREGCFKLNPILEGLTDAPMLDAQYGVSFEEDLSNVAGAIIVSLADVFTVINPDLENPQTEDWNKAFRLYSVLRCAARALTAVHRSAGCLRKANPVCCSSSCPDEETGTGTCKSSDDCLWMKEVRE